MTSQTRYIINAPRIVHEIMDGEVVAIDLDTGSYFSTNAVGTAIWNTLLSRPTVQEASAFLEASYDGDVTVIREAVLTYINKLLAEELIKACDAPSALAPLASPRDAKKSFEQPTIDKYDDMQALLQADPVHDVEDIKWPAADTA